jgi:hypothetical protein
MASAMGIAADLASFNSGSVGFKRAKYPSICAHRGVYKAMLILSISGGN